MTEVGFPTDSLTTCSGCGILAGEQEQKILQLIAMNHSLKRELDAKDAEIAALRLDNGELALVIETEAIQAKRIMAEIAALREAVLWLNDNALSFPRIPDHVLARVIQSRRVLGQSRRVLGMKP